MEEIKCISRKEAVRSILDRVKLGGEEYETAAILTMSEQEAREIYEEVREIRQDVSYIDRDSKNFRK